MKNIILISLIFFSMNACSNTPEGQKILIETSDGDMKVVLYNETPLHRDNFVKLANEDYYTNLTFHRVIKGFMIQAGDIKSKKGDTLKEFDKGNLIDAEFRTPKYFHKAGALAAARWGDDENPEKKSDAFQFYIVGGKIILPQDIKSIEKERFERLKQKIYQDLQSASMDSIKAMYKEGNRAGITELRASILNQAEKDAEGRKSEVLFTDEQKEVYVAMGGAPHLDGEYTVFGEVYEGLNIVQRIEAAETNMNDKPLKPIVIKKVSLIK